MGNWSTDSQTDYRNVRIVRDARYFAKNEKGPAVTYLTIVHGTKGGEDIFVDVRAVRGAELLGGLRKGDTVQVRGRVEFANDKTGVLRGKIWDGDVATLVNLKERASEDLAAHAAKEEAALETPDASQEAMGPAFD